jgi:hypothetical protein
MSQVSRVTVLFFACCVVLGITFLVKSRSKKVNEATLPDNSTPQELVFRSTMIFDGKTEDGTRFADYHYKSSDCISISHKIIFFESPARAREEIERESREASSIVERAPMVNDRGQEVGERVVMQFEASKEYKAHAEAIWNKNSDFHSIAAPSLEHVLEFEKAVGSQGGRIVSRLDAVQNVIFTASESRDGRTKEGFAYSEKEFRSSDCETITTRTEYFPSPDRAQEEMQSKLKESTNIIQRGPKLDATGQQVGERVVAMFKAEPTSEYIEDTVVIWTVNSEVHSIKGLFTHVLEFEKRNYRDD